MGEVYGGPDVYCDGTCTVCVPGCSRYDPRVDVDPAPEVGQDTAAELPARLMELTCPTCGHFPVNAPVRTPEPPIKLTTRAVSPPARGEAVKQRFDEYYNTQGDLRLAEVKGWKDFVYAVAQRRGTGQLGPLLTPAETAVMDHLLTSTEKSDESIHSG